MMLSYLNSWISYFSLILLGVLISVGAVYVIKSKKSTVELEKPKKKSKASKKKKEKLVENKPPQVKKKAKSKKKVTEIEQEKKPVKKAAITEKGHPSDDDVKQVSASKLTKKVDKVKLNPASAALPSEKDAPIQSKDVPKKEKAVTKVKKTNRIELKDEGEWTVFQTHKGKNKLSVAPKLKPTYQLESANVGADSCPANSNKTNYRDDEFNVMMNFHQQIVSGENKFDDAQDVQADAWKSNEFDDEYQLGDEFYSQSYAKVPDKISSSKMSSNVNPAVSSICKGNDSSENDHSFDNLSIQDDFNIIDQFSIDEMSKVLESNMESNDNASISHKMTTLSELSQIDQDLLVEDYSSESPVNDFEDEFVSKNQDESETNMNSLEFMSRNDTVPNSSLKSSAFLSECDVGGTIEPDILSNSSWGISSKFILENRAAAPVPLKPVSPPRAQQHQKFTFYPPLCCNVDVSKCLNITPWDQPVMCALATDDFRNEFPCFTTSLSSLQNSALKNKFKMNPSKVAMNKNSNFQARVPTVQSQYTLEAL